MRTGVGRDIPLTIASVTAISIALAAAPESAREFFEFDRGAVVDGELWRLWTAHLVHYSPRHALVDIIAMTLAGTLIEVERGSRYVLMLLVVAAAVVSVVVALAIPGMWHFRGASALVTLLAVHAGASCWYSMPGSRPVLVVLGAALVAKIILEASGNPPDAADISHTVFIAWQPHAIGAALGLFAGIERHRANPHVARRGWMNRTRSGRPPVEVERKHPPSIRGE